MNVISALAEIDVFGMPSFSCWVNGINGISSLKLFKKKKLVAELKKLQSARWNYMKLIAN